MVENADGPHYGGRQLTVNGVEDRLVEGDAVVGQRDGEVAGTRNEVGAGGKAREGVGKSNVGGLRLNCDVGVGLAPNPNRERAQLTIRSDKYTRATSHRAGWIRLILERHHEGDGEEGIAERAGTRQHLHNHGGGHGDGGVGLVGALDVVKEAVELVGSTRADACGRPA